MKIFILSIIISFAAHAGLSFNQIINETQEIYNPLVINQKLVFKGENSYLWFNLGYSGSSYQPTINGANIKVNNLLKIGNFIVFINKSDGDTLWKTDGESFTRMSDVPLAYITDYMSNVVTAKLIESGDFLVTDGIDATLYNIQPLSLNINDEASVSPSACYFDKNNLLFREATTKDLYIYQSGKISPIQLNSGEIDGDHLQFNLQLGNYCFYRYFDYENNIALHYKIDNNGFASLIENPETGYFDDLLVFNNQLLLFLKGSYSEESSYLFTLPDDSNIPNMLTINNFIYLPKSMWSTDNYLYVFIQSYCVKAKCSPVPPNPFQLLVFDKSFNLVNTIKDYNLSNFTLNSADDKDFLIYRNGVDKLVLIDSGIDIKSVKDALVDIQNVIGGNQQNYYVYGTNRLTNKLGLYKISEQPVISKQLTGLWTSEEWQKQGLSIHTGTRIDKTQYIFVSFYIYRDGQPFWIAGNAELATGQISQTIGLKEYKGQSFLSNDPTQDFEQLSFGDITIRPQACNQIHIQIDLENTETIELNMDRIVNTAYANTCTDE